MLLAAIVCLAIPTASAVRGIDLDPLCVHQICVGVEVENDRDTPLWNPQYYLNHGILVNAIKPMPPHSKQSFLMRMILWSSSGVDAVFSLYTGKRQVVVYLSAPSSFSERTNQIGVAITKEGYYNKVQQYFDKMKEHDLGDMFEAWSIKRFADSSKPLVVRAGNLTVTASMGAEHITSAIIKIS